MSTSIPESVRDHADLALAVYLEELAARRRVLFVGDAASAVPDRLSTVASSVEVVSPRKTDGETRRSGRIVPRPWPAAQDAHSWDLVLVPELVEVGPPNPERISEMATWLTPQGALVVGVEVREGGIRYEALYDLLASHFEYVRMLGQAPFSGWTVVDFQRVREGFEMTFDGSMLGGRGEHPARYVALCSSSEIVLDPYVVIQVPASTMREAAGRSGERLRDDASTEARISQLEVELRARQRELDHSKAHTEDLERELAAVRARLEDAELCVEQSQRDLTDRTQKLEEARLEVDRLTRALDEARAELQALRAEADAASVEREYADLEAALAERAREIAELRREVDRRGVLVRDLVEELREVRERGAAMVSGPVGRAGGEGSSGAERTLQMALEAAERRAVDAEAALAEARVRFDEARAELELCRKQREAERAAIQRELADAEGRARGFLARLAETEELLELCEARLAVAHDDLASTRGRVRELERALEETRDQLRSAFVRPPPIGERELESAVEARLSLLLAEHAEREGRLYGALVQARESALELHAQLKKQLAELVALRAERDALETRLGQLAAEATAAAAEAERTAAELAMCRERLDADRRALRELRGEREGLRLRLSDAEAALAARGTGSVPVPAVDVDREASVAEFRKTIAALEASVADWAERSQQALARADEEARRAAELGVRLSARDALIARLQSQLGDGVARQESLQERARELELRVTELRDALEAARASAEARVEDERREAQRIGARLAEVEKARERIEREHEATRRALREVRDMLTQIADGLEGGTLAGNLVSPAAGVGEVQLASEIDSLRREVVNREVHLRTSTPQSTERDEGLAGGEPVAGGERDGDRELRQRLSLAEERALRLERELAEERAARREAEASASALAERDAEVRRLHQLLGDREAQLKVLDGQLAQSEHEVKAMRDAFAQARAGLESLLGDIANDQRAEAADRIASMLRVLRRFEH